MGNGTTGNTIPINPNGQGFDEFVGFCAGHIGNYFDPVLEHNAGTIETKGFITDVLTDKAIEWIEAKRNEKLLLLHTVTMHRTRPIRCRMLTMKNTAPAVWM